MRKNEFIKETFKNMFLYQNINQLPTGIDKITISSTLEKDTSLKHITKVSALLEILTGQRSFLLRARSSNIFLKRKKGVPVGSKVTLRKNRALLFHFILLYEIFPQFKEISISFTLKKIERFRDNFILSIENPLFFKELKDFYFFFKDVQSLKIVSSFKKSRSLHETYLYTRCYKVPLKSKS